MIVARSEDGADATERLRERVARHAEEHPGAHAREVADALGVAEGKLVALRVGDGVTALDGRFEELMKGLPALGDVKVMTRNRSAVIERRGTFEGVEIDGPMGQVLGEEIDLRLFLRAWRCAFAVEDPSPRGMRRSLQVFDHQGASIHKIYLEDPTRLDAYHDLVERHWTASPHAELERAATPAVEKSDAEIDVKGLREAWDAMDNTHEFFGLLRRFGVSRTQALRLSGRERAEPIEVAAFERALGRAAAVAMPIMIFVGNRGAIQIYSGPIRRVEHMHGWLNVLDRRFNLHVRKEDVASAWAVRKPTSDGVVTSIELFDEAGENILLMFSKRSPRATEDPAWRELVADVAARAR